MDFFVLFTLKKSLKNFASTSCFNPDFILFSIKAVYRQSTLPL